MLTPDLIKEITDDTALYIQKKLKKQDLHLSLNNISQNNETLQFSVKISVDKNFDPVSKQRYLEQCNSLGLSESILNQPFTGTDGMEYEVIGVQPREAMPLKMKHGKSSYSMGINRFKRLHPKYAL